jgi:hypothetical protein
MSDSKANTGKREDQDHAGRTGFTPLKTDYEYRAPRTGFP